eukprot:scaffold1298_cov382-Prasinococcus_capsulatus_cf.AAC.18
MSLDKRVDTKAAARRTTPTDRRQHGYAALAAMGSAHSDTATAEAGEGAAVLASIERRAARSLAAGSGPGYSIRTSPSGPGRNMDAPSVAKVSTGSPSQREGLTGLEQQQLLFVVQLRRPVGTGSNLVAAAHQRLGGFVSGLWNKPRAGGPGPGGGATRVKAGSTGLLSGTASAYILRLLADQLELESLGGSSSTMPGPMSSTSSSLPSSTSTQVTSSVAPPVRIAYADVSRLAAAPDDKQTLHLQLSGEEEPYAIACPARSVLLGCLQQRIDRRRGCSDSERFELLIGGRIAAT